MPSPPIVLVHGAFADGSGWRKRPYRVLGKERAFTGNGVQIH